MSELADEIKRWVVNDYFTPNIKAEVILDALLTPYIADIVKAQCSSVGKELAFVTKEMSIAEFIPEQEEREKYGNRGTKIDYILADKDYVYLVELKTASTSIDDEQVVRYIKNCAGKKFGEALGDKLVKIMKSKSVNTPPYTVKDIKKVFEDRFNKNKCELLKGNYADQARELLKKMKLNSTNKYLYTIGQILDYVYKDEKNPRDIWNNKLKLIYITPDERKILPNGVGEKWKLLYVKDDCTSVSLEKSLSTLKKLKEKNKKNEEKRDYIDLLIGIIKELYPEKKEEKHD